MTSAFQDQNSTSSAAAVASDRAWLVLLAAWAISLGSTLGALFIGEIMGQTPCQLCWYQRIFMFPLAIMLGIALLRNDLDVDLYALPLSVLGGAIAIYHSLLYAGLITAPIEPCGQGPSCSSAAMTILGSIPIPYLSAIAFCLIIVLLASSAIRRTA